MRIFLGPAGNCLRSAGEKTIDSISNLKGLGLNAQEIEFVRGTYMSNDEAERVGAAAKKLGIRLSVHASYFINLASRDKSKLHMSKKRILEACERMHHMGGGPVVFHPAYFGGIGKEQVFDAAKDAVTGMMDSVRESGWKASLAPETTGKHSALGSLEETIRLSAETGCSMCIDFAHLYARNAGVIDYDSIFASLKSSGTRSLHCHFSGIEYTEKGEYKHLIVGDSPPFGPLAEAALSQRWLDEMTIICESPVTWKDSLMMKESFMKLGHVF